jgi:hypothetical protein
MLSDGKVVIVIIVLIELYIYQLTRSIYMDCL